MRIEKKTTRDGRYHYRILRRIGGMFGLGVVTESAYHFIKGIYDSPAAGIGVRLSGGAQAVRMNVPRLGKRCAVWGGLYETSKCALEYVRKKEEDEDPWDSIISAAIASGLSGMFRGRGLAVSACSAATSGAVMALIQGAEIAVDKYKSAQEKNATTSHIFGQSVQGSRFEGSFQKFKFWRGVPV